jgi:hypothetical protein
VPEEELANVVAATKSAPATAEPIAGKPIEAEQQ